MKVRDTVEWRSQAAGCSRTKRGQIIEVVPPGHRARMKIKDRGMPRPHESYVIRASVIDGSEKQKKSFRVYWPRANKLKLVS